MICFCSIPAREVSTCVATSDSVTNLALTPEKGKVGHCWSLSCSTLVIPFRYLSEYTLRIIPLLSLSWKFVESEENMSTITPSKRKKIHCFFIVPHLFIYLIIHAY